MQNKNLFPNFVVFLGRGVTIQMLMADGMIQAGEGVLSLEYLVIMLNVSPLNIW